LTRCSLPSLSTPATCAQHTTTRKCLTPSRRGRSLMTIFTEASALRNLMSRSVEKASSARGPRRRLLPPEENYVITWYVHARSHIVIKNLTPIGNSEGLILDKTLLGLLGLERGSAVEIQIEGQTMTVRRASEAAIEGRTARFNEARKHVLARHGGTLKKLAK
jgi:antitoxin MazE